MAGPIGYIFHRSSRKLVHPDGGSRNPPNETKLVVHRDKDDPERLKFRFLPVQGFGHFGYIEHVASGKIVHPSGGELYPGNNTFLIYHSDRHAGALFAFDEDDRIIHKGGKIWHPLGGYPNPGDNTFCVLHSDAHDSAKFYFGDFNGTEISPYPNPNLSGTWKVVKAYINPKATHTFTQKYNIGKTLSKTVTEQRAWKVTGEIAFKLFKTSTEFSGFAQKASQSTWSKEYEETTTLKVEEGKTVVVWQFVFGMEQYGDKYSFQSSIIGDTDSLDKHPSI